MKQLAHTYVVLAICIALPLSAHLTMPPPNPARETIRLVFEDDVDSFESLAQQTMDIMPFHINNSDPDGSTPLGAAALYGYRNIFTYLQTEYNANETSALISAVAADNAPIVRALLNLGDRHSSENQMYAILSEALQNKATQSLALLRNNYGDLLWKGIVAGVKKNDAAISEYLLTRSAIDLNEPTHNGYTLLTLGITTGNTAIIEHCKKNHKNPPIASLEHALDSHNEMALRALNRYYLFPESVINNRLVSLAKKKSPTTAQEAIILHNNRLRSALLRNDRYQLDLELAYPNIMVTDDDMSIAITNSTLNVFKRLLIKRFPRFDVSGQAPYLEQFHEQALKNNKKDIAKYIAGLLASKRMGRR